MRRTSLLVAVPAALLLLAGCGLGPDAPRPGLAASVDGTRLSLAQLDDIVDAVCIRNTDDPQGQPTSRGIATEQMLEQWIQATAVVKYAATHHLTGTASAQDLTALPGWSRMDQDQRDALTSFAQLQERASAYSNGNAGLALDPADFDIVINPRFDLDMGAQGFTPADHNLSVAVSKEALGAGGQQLTAQQVAALPDGQLCGKRPTAG